MLFFLQTLNTFSKKIFKSLIYKTNLINLTCCFILHKLKSINAYCLFFISWSNDIFPWLCFKTILMMILQKCKQKWRQTLFWIQRCFFLLAVVDSRFYWQRFANISKSSPPTQQITRWCWIQWMSSTVQKHFIDVVKKRILILKKV